MSGCWRRVRTRHGCSVHLVTEDLDSGPILAQAEVPVLPGDTPEGLSARVLEAEHALYPRALAALASAPLPCPSPGP